MTFLRLLITLFTITNCYAVVVSVGDSYGDEGTVLCVSNTQDLTNCNTTMGASGEYGLIMSNKDLANLDSPNHGVLWSSKYSTTKAQSDNDGFANTQTIIAALPNPTDNTTNNAAWLCHDYRGGGYDNWYLPSKNELNKIYTYAKTNNLIGKNCTGNKANGIQCLIGGYDNRMFYWSSTELSAGSEDGAWSQYFSYGYQYYDYKARNHFGVRALRVFNPLTLYPFNTLKNLENEQKQKAAAELKLQQEAAELKQKQEQEAKQKAAEELKQKQEQELRVKQEAERKRLLDEAMRQNVEQQKIKLDEVGKRIDGIVEQQKDGFKKVDDALVQQNKKMDEAAVQQNTQLTELAKIMRKLVKRSQ